MYLPLCLFSSLSDVFLLLDQRNISIRYDRLLLSVSESELPFSIVSVLATDANGEFVDAKIKSLIRLFRPDRGGDLSRLDFVRSIDAVYKQLRLLRASIGNSGETLYVTPCYNLCSKRILTTCTPFQRKSISPLRRSSIASSTSSCVFVLYQFWDSTFGR